jgi:hypothetical protein
MKEGSVSARGMFFFCCFFCLFFWFWVQNKNSRFFYFLDIYIFLHPTRTASSVLGPLSAPCVAALCTRSQGASRFIAAEVAAGLLALCTGVGDDGAVVHPQLEAAGHKHPAVRGAGAGGLAALVDGCAARGEAPPIGVAAGRLPAGIMGPGSPSKLAQGASPAPGSPGPEAGASPWGPVVAAAVGLSRDRLPATRDAAKRLLRGVDAWMGQGAVGHLSARLSPADKREIEKILA